MVFRTLGAVDIIKHSQPPFEYCSYRERSLSYASENTQFYATRMFFFSLLFSCNNDDHLGQTFHRFAIVCTAGIQQVRILVFDNYKRCPVPLSIDLFINFSLIDFLGVDYFPNSVQLTRLKRCLQVNQAAFFKGRVNKYGTQP